MMRSIQSEQERTRLARERGWIVRLLYHARPRALEVAQLRHLLDQRNFPLSSRKLAEQIQYLCELRVVSVEHGGDEKALEDGALRRALTRYSEADSEGFAESLFVRLTAAGVNLQEGVSGPLDGIAIID